MMKGVDGERTLRAVDVLSRLLVIPAFEEQ